MGSPENPNWVFDYGLIEDIPVPRGDLPSLEPSDFSWPSHSLTAPPTTLSVELDQSCGNSEGFKESGSKKRPSSGCCNLSNTKACREKVRRDRLNDRHLFFFYLAFVSGTGFYPGPGPGRPSKMDKAVILSDAVRVVSQLRKEAQKLRESNENLQEKINELKAENNELRDEKQQLKVEKDNIEQKLKVLSSQLSFLPDPPTILAPFPAPGQVVGRKLVPFISYPGVSMWQFLPPAAVDTSQDHVLRPRLHKLGLLYSCAETNPFISELFLLDF